MMRSMLILASLAAYLALCNAVATDYNYEADGANGPSNWDGMCTLATSMHQSPIDLVNPQYHTDLTPFQFHMYDDATNDTEFTLKNTGHTAQLDVPPAQQAEISGGGLEGRYTLAQLHFHWGLTNDHGSEHHINGSEYPLEVHFVHYKSEFDGLGAAVTDGSNTNLAVLGFMFEVGDTNNTDFNPIFSGMESIIQGDETTPVTKFDLGTLIPTDPGYYFRYPGSLTTPPCLEAVVWTVFKTPLTISQTQMALFRDLQYSTDATEDPQIPIGGTGFNYRPLQQLHDRDILSSDPNDPEYVAPTVEEGTQAPVGTAHTAVYSAVLLAAVCLLHLVA